MKAELAAERALAARLASKLTIVFPLDDPSIGEAILGNEALIDAAAAAFDRTLPARHRLAAARLIAEYTKPQPTRRRLTLDGGMGWLESLAAPADKVAAATR